MERPGDPINEHHSSENSRHFKFHSKVHCKCQGCWTEHTSNRMVEEVVKKILELTLKNELLVNLSLVFDALCEGVLPGIELQSLDVLESLTNFIRAFVGSFSNVSPCCVSPLSRAFVDSHLSQNEADGGDASVANFTVELVAAVEELSLIHISEPTRPY